VYKTTTIYVNTTKIVEMPVVNITGVNVVYQTGSFTVSAAFDSHELPTGTVTWLTLRAHNLESNQNSFKLSVQAPFAMIATTPALPAPIVGGGAITVIVAIGLPYAPGNYTCSFDVW
jgi:hypothetical protein